MSQGVNVLMSSPRLFPWESGVGLTLGGEEPRPDITNLSNKRLFTLQPLGRKHDFSFDDA